MIPDLKQGAVNKIARLLTASEQPLYLFINLAESLSLSKRVKKKLAFPAEPVAIDVGVPTSNTKDELRRIAFIFVNVVSKNRKKTEMLLKVLEKYP